MLQITTSTISVRSLDIHPWNTMAKHTYLIPEYDSSTGSILVHSVLDISWREYVLSLFLQDYSLWRNNPIKFSNLAYVVHVCKKFSSKFSPQDKRMSCSRTDGTWLHVFYKLQVAPNENKLHRKLFTTSKSYNVGFPATIKSVEKLSWKGNNKSKVTEVSRVRIQDLKLFRI